MKSWLCSSKNTGIVKRLIVNAFTRAKAIELAHAYFAQDGQEFNTCVSLDSDGLEEVVFEFLQ